MAGKGPGRGGNSDAPTIIIRREEGEEAGHHGGAWKVAYADFMTAMMAFFLLMWLLNATTEEQRTGLADYFAPTNLFGHSVSGSGQPFGGKTPNEDGSSVSNDGAPQAITGKKPPQIDVAADQSDTQAQPGDPASGPGPGTMGAAGAQTGAAPAPTNLAAQGEHVALHGGDYAAASLTPPPPGAPANATQPAPPPGGTAGADPAQVERRALSDAGAKLLDAIRQDPSLQDVAGQLIIDNVPEGLRIQVVDAERRPMFALGSSQPTDRVRALMAKVVPSLAGLPNRISVAGHTDALTYRGQGKDNWDLSTERANATRRILTEAGLDPDRIRQVTGDADRDLLDPANPQSPVNRRITLVVLRMTGASATKN